MKIVAIGIAAFAALIGTSVMASAQSAQSQSTEDILRRLQAIEASNAALSKETAALRERVTKLSEENAKLRDRASDLKGSNQTATTQQTSTASASAVRRADPKIALYDKTSSPMAVKAPPPAPVPVYNWTGWYVGVNAGGGMAFGTIDDKSAFFSASDGFQRGFAEVGGQIGYNWQFGSTVLGIEGDWNWNSLDHTGLMGGDQCVAAQTSLKLSQFGSVRARAGLAFERTLAYVTAGPAWGKLEGSVTSICQNTAGCVMHSLAFWSTDSWQWGALAGAGLEFMITPNLSVRAEYLALALTDSTVSPDRVVRPINCTSSPTQTRECQISFQLWEQIARLGLNYRFW
jgi:outer membrane immunogenic protein